MTREAASEPMPTRPASQRKRSSLPVAMAAAHPPASLFSFCSATQRLSGSLGTAVDNSGRAPVPAARAEPRGWSQADTEHYRVLADRYRDGLRQRERENAEVKPAAVASVSAAATPLQESLNMRTPRPRSDRASDFIPQCDLVPLDPAMRLLAPPPPPRLLRRRRSDTQNGGDGADDDSDGAAELAPRPPVTEHDLSPELIERSQALLLEQFHEYHRCCNVFHVMAYHPEYLDGFLQFHNSLLQVQESGPIGLAERHYLAIMAAARHRCSYLVHLHAIEFIHLNGDPAWLRGLVHASPKIRKLGPLCRLLAHRPWEVTPAVLQSLLTGPDSYSQSEFVHALCLLSHFIALAGFVAGTGVRPELDFPHGYTYRCDSGDRFSLRAASLNGSCAVPSSPAPSSPGIDPKQRVLDLMEAIKDLDRTAEQDLQEDQLLQRFETVEQETADIRFHKAASKEALVTTADAGPEQGQIIAELANFCEDPAFEYKDFYQAKLESKSHSFRIQDYSWEEDGSCLTERFLPNVGAGLNKRFQTSFNLTYGTMGANTEVQTEPFRRAVWYYVLSIFGLRLDDYDYTSINKMIPDINLKKYCKLVACCPDQVTFRHYKAAMPGFKQSERVHMNLVIMDSRMQVSMLYGLRALNTLLSER